MSGKSGKSFLSISTFSRLQLAEKDATWEVNPFPSFSAKGPSKR